MLYIYHNLRVIILQVHVGLENQCYFLSPSCLPSGVPFALLSSVSLAILSEYVYVLSVFLQSIPTLINHNNTIKIKN